MECIYCGSESVIKRGLVGQNKQRFGCKACKRTFRENPQPNAYAEARKEEILRAYHERSSLSAAACAA